MNLTLLGMKPPPLQMMLYGEGGSGKLKVIQTVTHLFQEKGVVFMLQKTSYMGIVASLMDGKTMHTLTGMSVRKKGKMSSECKQNFEEIWGKKLYLIIDEQC